MNRVILHIFTFFSLLLCAINSGHTAEYVKEAELLTRLEAKKVQQDLRKLSASSRENLLSGAAMGMSAGMQHLPVKSLSTILANQVPQYLTEKHSLKSQKSLLGVSKKNLGKNIFSYALTVAGIGAGTSLLKDYAETGQVRPEKALDFLADSQFYKTTAGIFAGSTLLTIAGHFLPPGVGPILKTVPGFLGAALGYEWSQGSLAQADFLKIGLSALVSSAAFVALGSGGLIAIAGGIAASMVTEHIYDKIVSKETKLQEPSRLQFEALRKVPPEEGYFMHHGEPVSKTPVQGSTPEEELKRRKLLKEIQDSANADQRDNTRELLLELHGN